MSETPQIEGLALKYFVLKPKGEDAYARASRKAMQIYAREIRDTDPLLADQLIIWADRERREANKDADEWTVE